MERNLDSNGYSKIKYIFFSDGKEYKKYCLSEILSYKNVVFSNAVFVYKYFSLIKRVLRKKLKINVSFPKCLYPLVFNKKWIGKNEIPVFFLFEYNLMSWNEKFLKHLKKMYPMSKFVFYFTNVPSTLKYQYGLNFILSHPLVYDLVLTYSKEDAKKFNFTYYPLPYSFINKKDSKKTIDLYFLGLDKGRGVLLEEIAYLCKRNNIQYNFNIVGDTAYDNELGISILTKEMSYQKNIDNTFHSKCVLELMPCGVQERTLRTAEVIATGTKLLTNNTALKNDTIFNPAQMSIFTSVEDIDLDFIKNDGDKELCNDPNMLSPKYFLQFLEETLFK